MDDGSMIVVISSIAPMLTTCQHLSCDIAASRAIVSSALGGGRRPPLIIIMMMMMMGMMGAVQRALFSDLSNNINNKMMRVI